MSRTQHWKICRHADVTGAALLNEATKKSIVAEMAPPELATDLRLNADRHNTYAQMKWQVLICGNMKLPRQPTTMRVDHVEPGEEHDQVDWNIDYFGKTTNGKGKNNSEGKGK